MLQPDTSTHEMAENDDDRPPGPDPIEIPLVGEGPFQLPLCTDLASITLGEAIAVLQLETMEGQRLDIPIPIGMLLELKDAAEEALQAAISARVGTMIQ